MSQIFNQTKSSWNTHILRPLQAKSFSGGYGGGGLSGSSLSWLRSWDTIPSSNFSIVLHIRMIFDHFNIYILSFQWKHLWNFDWKYHAGPLWNAVLPDITKGWIWNRSSYQLLIHLITHIILINGCICLFVCQWWRKAGKVCICMLKAALIQNHLRLQANGKWYLVH